MQVHTHRERKASKEIPAYRNIPSKAVYQTHLPAQGSPYLSFLALAQCLKVGRGDGKRDKVNRDGLLQLGAEKLWQMSRGQ